MYIAAIYSYLNSLSEVANRTFKTLIMVFKLRVKFLILNLIKEIM